MEHGILVLGALVGGAAALSVLLRFVRQSSIIALIVVGVIAGAFHEHIHISDETVELFTDLGIIMLLFMAGLEIDFHSFVKRWKVVLTNGLGQIIANVLIGASLAVALLGIRDIAAVAFFGLCLTFSSTIVVIGALKSKKAMESYHGQIILGIMVLQDITAVMALVLLKSMSGEGSLAAAVGVVTLKMIALILVLAALAKSVLPRVFRYLAREKDLLFIGSLGWVLGIAAICEAAHFSAEIGAFMAGAALSALPYRLEVQDKVEPMKDFGIILFFLSLGYDLKIDSSAVSLLGPVSVVAAVVLFGTPVLMLVIGFFTRARSRPTFYIGLFINQISEFSLILATLCVQSGVFTQETFLLVTLATITTMCLSCCGHEFMDNLYGLVSRPLSFLDSRSKRTERTSAELEGHVVIAKFNEIAEPCIDHFLSKGKKVLLVDIDPEVHHLMSKRHEALTCMYSDIFDPDTWEEAGISKAYVVISCLVQGQEADLALLRWMKDNRLDVPFVASTDSREDARDLYRQGATFVIQTEDLAGEHVALLLQECSSEISALRDRGKVHYDRLISATSRPTARFT